MQFSFHDLVVDAERLEIRRGDATIEVQPKVLQVLIYLLRHSDRTVPKRELLDAVWPDVATGENSLARAISLARKLVGKAAIENVRGEGYRIAVSVERSGAASVTPASPAFEIAGFVGRRDERRSLDRFADEARRGGFVALVRGEPGIGKTRLAHEFTRASRQRGFRVLWGMATEGAPRPYGFWRDLLLAVVANSTTEDLVDRFGEAIQVVTEVLPELREQHPTMPRPIELHAENARSRFFECVGQIIQGVSVDKPLVLVIDDLHWADLGSLRLLEATIRASAGEPVLWLLLARRSANVEGAALDEVLPVWRPGTRVLELQGLDAGTVNALVVQAGADAPEPDVLASLCGRTHGNPLFVQQLVRAGLAAPRAHEPDAALEQAHLRSVTDVVNSRIEQLPEASCRALQIAAVYGSSVPVDVVADVAGCDELELLDALAPAEAARLVVVERDGTRFSFDHELVREALLSRVPAGERARAHRGIAESLERNLSSNEAHLLPILAWHYGRSATRAAAKKAVDYGLRAARQQAASLAFESAAAHFEQAIRTAERAGLGDERSAAVLWLELARTQFHAASPMDAERSAWKAVELARAVGAAEVWADAAASMSLWNLHSTGQVPVPRVETLEAAIPDLDAGAHLVRSRALAALAQDLHWAPDRERMRGLAREALEEARLAGDEPNHRVVLLSLYHVFAAPGETAERDRLVAETLALTPGCNDPEFEFNARFHDFARAVEHGEAATAAEHVSELERLAGELRRDRYRFAYANAAANLCTHQGRFEEAESLRAVGESLEQNRTADIAFLTGAAQLFVLRRLQGRLAELETPIGVAMTRFPSTGLEASQALLLLEIGKTDEARALIDSRWRDGRFDVGAHMLSAANLTLLAEAVVSIGTDAQVREAGSQLELLTGRMVVLQSVLTVGSADRVLALVAARLGAHERAEQLFESALVLEGGLGARPWEAMTARDFATWLRGRGRDAEAAIQQARAADLAAAIGMTSIEP